MLDDVSPELLGDLYDPAPAGSVAPARMASEGEQPTPQYRSRRELREAEARSASTAGSPTSDSTTSGSTASISRRDARASVREVKPVREVKRARAVRTQQAAISSTPQPASRSTSRKNPFSVLATMAVVGGMFAVAGLPAYATQENVVSADDTTTASGSAQTLSVGADVAAAATVRDGFRATTPEQLAEANEDAIRAANNEAYMASGARERGDDYPWPYELTDDQGGGLSPLNYYYRECVDFVAWRINRDQGYFAAPFKWVWSNLTPYGGNGGQWLYNWESLGRTVSNTPIPGAVAYTGGNHVAYVKSVNGDGTVTIEEYNYIPGMYGQRTIPASSVVAFLYPPS